MSSQARGIFERFLEETGLRTKRPLPESSPDEGTAELFLLAQRLRRLRSVRAPARLRPRVLAEMRERPVAPDRVLQPAIFVDVDSADLQIAQRLRELPSLRAPGRLRARALAPSREWQSARRVIPLDQVRRARTRFVGLASRAVAAVGIVLFAGYSTYAVSASPLPGSPFYPFKLWAEDVQVAVASPSDRPHILMQQADQRLDETRRLIESSQYPEAEKTVKDAERLIESARASADQATRPQQVLSAANDAEVRAQAVVQKLPQHSPAISAVVPNPPAPVVRPLSEPAAAVPVPAPADPLIVPAGADPQALAPGAAAPSSAVSAPIPQSIEVIAGANPSLPVAPSAPLVAPSGSAPSADFAPIQTNTPAPSRTPTAGSAGAATATTGATATRTVTPAQAPPPPTSAPPAPAGSPGVAAPVGPMTEIPPR